MYIIYVHINKINHKSYVGQTKQELERRWRKDGEGYKKSPLFYNAIQKYGWDNFDHIILEECPNSEVANEREIYWINYYNSFQNGYNLTPGGNNYMEEMWKDPDFKKKMKASFSKRSKRLWQDKNFAELTQKKMQQGLQNFWNDSEKRNKRIEAISGKKNPNSKMVQNIETGKIFNTIKEASEWAGLTSISGIGECCKGKQKTSGKHPITNQPLHWRYYNDNKIIEITYIVECINTGKKFERYTDAAKWSNLKDKGASIKACCKGKQKTAGFHPETKERLQWRFVSKGGDYS